MEEWTEHLGTLIREKWTDYLFYEEFLHSCNEDWEAECVRQLMEEDKRHYESFQRLYHERAGDFFRFQPEPMGRGEKTLEAVLQREIRNYKFYRHMLLTAPSSEASTPFYIAMTDDIGHAVLINALLAASK